MPSAGWNIFVSAEMAYHAGNMQDAFDKYHRAIKKMIKDEPIDALVPYPPGFNVPRDTPLEALPTVWKNFHGFFKDTTLSVKFTEETQPDAYKFLKSFSVSSKKAHPEFNKNARTKLILQFMQITAGHCLGLLAWDKRDRATAAKRYKETLEFTDTIPGMSSLSPNSKHLEYCVQIDVKEMRENLERILYNDGVNLALLNQTDAERRTNIAVPNVRMEFDGTITQEQVVMVASDACKACGKRDVKLSRCQKCKTAHYCGVDCQRADWREHKAACKAIAAQT